MSARPRPIALIPSLVLGAALLVATAVAAGFGGTSEDAVATRPVAGSAAPSIVESVLGGTLDRPPGEPASSSAASAAAGPTAAGPATAEATTAEPTAAPSLVADHCVDRDLPAPAATDVVLTVLDRTYRLSEDYVPPDLVPAAEAGFTGASGDRLIRAIVIPDLAAMRAAMVADGLTISLDSAYRAYWTQVATFDSWVARLGEAEAVARSARPGHSEHQLGTTIDVTSPGWANRFGDWARDSAEGAWLAAHAWEYGFVMSYPMGSEAETCFSYEPWHYRWIGREAAAEHRTSGQHLRRFLERFVVGGGG